MTWVFAAIPVGVATLGAAWTSLRPPPPKVIGTVQHFAAGIVFYAAAGEILPDVIRQGAIWPVVVGGGLGILAMLGLRHVTERIEAGPAGLIGAAAIDALIDGLVLGLGFHAGRKQGELLAIALAVEFLFLGLSIAGAFGARARSAIVVAASAGVALAVPLGVLVAIPIGHLPPIWQTAAFAFGLIALLYLVTEELLTEAHEKPETAFGPAAFFVGFLALTVLNEMMG